MDIQSLDFTGIKNRLCDPSRNYKLTNERAVAAEARYKTLLNAMKGGATDIKSLLTDDIDEFWHLHILDTIQYRSDCHTIFGTFIEHIPT